MKIIFFTLAYFSLNCKGQTIIHQPTNTDSCFKDINNSPVLISQKITNDFFSHTDFMLYETNEVSALHYAEVATAFGIARIAGLLHDTATIHKLEKRYNPLAMNEVKNTENHVDANVYGVLLLELFKQTGNEYYLSEGLRLADGQWKDTLENGLTSQTRYWIDDIWMVGVLQLQAFRVTKKTIYLDRVALFISIYLNHLQQPNGLFYHGPNAQFYWGRGNGWVAAGIAELLIDLPPGHPLFDTILIGYKKMMLSLLQFQTNDGMWRQLIDYETAWEETSATAMFGYAFVIGVSKGFLPANNYKPGYEMAWNSLTKYLTADGKLELVCVGTGQNDIAEYYLGRSTSVGDFHGQAAVLWFAYALLLTCQN